MSVVVPFVFPEMNQRSAVQMLQTCISLLVPSNLLVYPKRQFRRSTPFPPMWVAPRNLAKARRGTRSHIQLPTHAFVMSICVFFDHSTATPSLASPVLQHISWNVSPPAGSILLGPPAAPMAPGQSAASRTLDPPRGRRPRPEWSEELGLRVVV